MQPNMDQVLKQMDQSMRDILWSYNWAILLGSIGALLVIFCWTYIAVKTGQVMSQLAGYFDAKKRREEVELKERERILEEEKILRRFTGGKKPPGTPPDDDAPYRPKM